MTPGALPYAGGDVLPDDRRYADEEWLRRRLERDGWSVLDVANECGVSQTTVYRWRDVRGIGDWEPPVSESELRGLHHDREMCVAAVAGETGHSAITIERSLGQHGVERRHYRKGRHNNAWDGGTDPPGQEWRRTKRYEELRRRVFRRDGWVCVICGDEPDEPHIHHITPVVDGGEKFADDNAATVCGPCHRTVHRR